MSGAQMSSEVVRQVADAEGEEQEPQRVTLPNTLPRSGANDVSRGAHEKGGCLPVRPLGHPAESGRLFVDRLRQDATVYGVERILEVQGGEVGQIPSKGTVGFEGHL
jgi:hypothetical protein